MGLKGVPTGAFPAINPAGISGIGSPSERKQFPIRQHSRTIGNATSAQGGDFGDNQQNMDLHKRKLDKGPGALDIIHRLRARSPR